MEISSGVLFLTIASLATLAVKCGKLGSTRVDKQSWQLHTSTCPCSKKKYDLTETEKIENSTHAQDLPHEFFRQSTPTGRNLGQVVNCRCGCHQLIKEVTRTTSEAPITETTTVSGTDLTRTTDLMTSDGEESTMVYSDAATTVSSGYRYNKICNNDSSECIVVVSYPKKRDFTLTYRCYPPSKCATTSKASMQVNKEDKTNKADKSNLSDKISGGAIRTQTEKQQMVNGGSLATHHHTGYTWIGHHSQSSSSHSAAGDHTYSLSSHSTSGDYTYSQGTAVTAISHSSTSMTDMQKEQGSKPSDVASAPVLPISESNESKPILSMEKPGNGETKPIAGLGGGGNGGKYTTTGSGGGGGYTLTTGFIYPKPFRTTARTTTTYKPYAEEVDSPSENILTPPNCGVFNQRLFNRIKGGSPSTAGKWSWVVAFGYEAPGRTGDGIAWLCGGALITAKSSVTAAHCLDHPSMKLTKARFGDLDLEDDEDGANPITKDVSTGIKHPLFNNREFSHDIAIVVLKRPLRFTEAIKPICLPFGKDIRNEKFNEMEPYIAGWGYLDHSIGRDNSMLYEAQVPVVPNEDCAQVYSGRLNRTVRSSHICAGGSGRDSCQGDSGGPLMVPWNQHFYAIGLVSWGFTCGTPGYPGVYTRITSYLDWLQENIK